MWWLLLQLAPAPPIPPPPADRLEAAVALWDEHPLPETVRQRAIEGAVSSTASYALYAAGVELGSRRWNEKYDQLRVRLRAHVPVDMSRVEREATVCLAEQIARQLSVEEIAELRRFAATSGGEKFWQMANWGSYQITTCYQMALALELSDDDYRAAGMKPPRHDPGMQILS